MLILPLLAMMVAAPGAEVRVTSRFEGGSIGRVEVMPDGVLRCHVAGQADQRGRNRQATWYYFRIDGAKGVPLTITLTDLVGEYNNRPGAVAMNADTVPVYSSDNRTWRHFPTMEWDEAAKEATVRITPEQDRIWIAHVPPYPNARIESLVRELRGSPWVKVEDIGRSVKGSPLHLVTITDRATPEEQKLQVWIITRQHAWEAGTSWVAEGLLRFLCSDDKEAATLRNWMVVRVVPTMDPDGCAEGKVRFNANGFDVNRNWDQVDARGPRDAKMPEIWSVKRRLLADLQAKKIALLLNLHNTETAEYLEIPSDDAPLKATAQKLYDRLVAVTSFDPSRPLGVSSTPADTTSSIYRELGIPVMLMEQRIGTGTKLKRRPEVEDRLAFGRDLIKAIAYALF